MKLTVIAVGRVREPLQAAVADFETRAARYWKLQVVEVEAGSAGRGGKAPSDVMQSEGARLLDRLPAGAEAWALSREGKPMSSDRLAADLAEKMLHGSRGVAFLIGGAFGLDRAALDRADRVLSLSAMTLPHEMARLVLAEQLYRAGTILRNEPYHKGAH